MQPSAKILLVGRMELERKNSVHPNDLLYESTIGLPHDFNMRFVVGCYLVQACYTASFIMKLVVGHAYTDEHPLYAT